MSWEISLHPEVEAWYPAICVQDPQTADLIQDAIDQLAEEGPTALRVPKTFSMAYDLQVLQNR